MSAQSVHSIDRPRVFAQKARDFPPIAVAWSAYAALVMIMWGAFSPGSGLGYETAFPYMSETGSWWSGFLYSADSLRIHTNTFYHLSYLLSVALGIRGSYVPYQVVYALLWWARGVLVFSLLRRFLGGRIVIPYVAGALVIAHSSDGALQWVGQMNQFGFIFWMLLAFYLLTRAVGATGKFTRLALLISACFFEYMSLWSYESQLFMILVFPAALLLLRPAWRRWSLATAGWYVVPGAYLCLTAHRYLISRGGGYQESVVRAQWGLISLGQDWWFNIQSSLQFWAWLREPIPLGNVTAVLSVVAALTFFAAGLALFRMEHRPDQSDPPVRTWGLLFASGAVLLALSFPAYLLLASARGLWRTQFLSGIGTGLVWTAVVGLISAAFRQRVMRSIIVLALSAGIVYFGATSAIAKGALHRRQWENHRAMLVGILRIAPKVNPNTIIVLTGVPKNPDPFGHNMWLDLALRLCYPGIPVSGIYYYADGTPSPGSNLEAVGDAWKMQATGFPTLVRDTSLANTIVVEWSTSRPAQLAKSIPDFICHAQCAETLYNPAHVITTPISPIAVNRYHP